MKIRESVSKKECDPHMQVGSNLTYNLIQCTLDMPFEREVS